MAHLSFPLGYIRAKSDAPAHTQPSQLEKYGFVISIIGGIGALAVGGVGLAGYFHLGVLSNMVQMDAVTMIASGVGGGALLLMIGIVGAVKNRKADHRPEISSMHQSVYPTSNSRSERDCGAVSIREDEFIRNTSRGTIRGAQCFGKAGWETCFGDVGDEPFLPENINTILDSPCPFSGDEKIKVKDTHMLVLIPATVAGEALTLDKLGQLIQNPKKGDRRTKYRLYENSMTKVAHGSTKVDRSHWVLMMKDVLPNSKDKTGSDQKELAEQYATQHYVVPDVIEAAVCIFMEFIVSGKYLYGFTTYTRCAQTVQQGKYSVTVGNFDCDGLDIGIIGGRSHSMYGIALLRRF